MDSTYLTNSEEQEEVDLFKAEIKQKHEQLCQEFEFDALDVVPVGEQELGLFLLDDLAHSQLDVLYGLEIKNKFKEQE